MNSKVFFYGFNSVIDNTASQSPRLGWTQAFPSQNISNYNMWHRHYKFHTSHRCLWNPKTIPNRGENLTLWKLLGTATNHMGSASSCRNSSIPALQYTAPHKSKAVLAAESAPLGCASALGDTFSHDKQVDESYHNCKLYPAICRSKNNKIFSVFLTQLFTSETMYEASKEFCCRGWFSIKIN